MTKTAFRKKPEIQTAETNQYLPKLAEEYGYEEAGRLIGVSGSAISTMLKENKIRRAYEMAAELHYRKSTPREERLAAAFIIKLTPEQRKWIEPLFQHHNIDLISIVELVEE